jgi:TFIIF-interacting CTD phosphatase-like protein
VRPGAEGFLEEMAKHYEVCIFTAAMQDVRNLIKISMLMQLLMRLTQKDLCSIDFIDSIQFLKIEY